jgi:hypothetical protein
VKHTRPFHPLANAATETNGETMPEVDVLWVKPMRTSLPPELPVSVMSKHFTGPLYTLFTVPGPLGVFRDRPIPHPHFA